jgi:hypothetical protein
MEISVNPNLETKLRARAKAEGLTIEAYLERLLDSEGDPERELEQLALDGLLSGDPVEVDHQYWERKHRLLNERLKLQQ